MLFCAFIACTARPALAGSSTTYTVDVSVSPCDIALTSGSVLNMPKVPKNAFENAAETPYSGNISMQLSCPGGTSGKTPYLTISGDKDCAASAGDSYLFCANSSTTATGVGFILREGTYGDGNKIPSYASGTSGYKYQIPGTDVTTDLDGKTIDFHVRYSRGVNSLYQDVTPGTVTAALNFNFTYE